MPFGDNPAPGEVERLEQEAAKARQARELRRRRRVARFRLIGEVARSGTARAVRDLSGLAGVGLIAYGAWTIYPAAGLIVGGALLLAGAWVSGARDSG